MKANSKTASGTDIADIVISTENTVLGFSMMGDVFHKKFSIFPMNLFKNTKAVNGPIFDEERFET